MDGITKFLGLFYGKALQLRIYGAGAIVNLRKSGIVVSGPAWMTMHNDEIQIVVLSNDSTALDEMKHDESEIIGFSRKVWSRHGKSESEVDRTTFACKDFLIYSLSVSDNIFVQVEDADVLCPYMRIRGTDMANIQLTKCSLQHLELELHQKAQVVGRRYETMTNALYFICTEAARALFIYAERSVFGTAEDQMAVLVQVHPLATVDVGNSGPAVKIMRSGIDLIIHDVWFMTTYQSKAVKRCSDPIPTFQKQWKEMCPENQFNKFIC